MAPVGFADKVAFVWKVADKLRGTFKQHEYGSVMLPLLVLRRMDAVLTPTKNAVLDTAVKTGVLAADRKTQVKTPDDGSDRLLKRAAGQRFYNLSPLTFTSMLQNDKALAEQLASYVRRLSPDAYAVMEAYNLDDKIQRMDRAGILYPVLADFADLDVRPTAVSNEAMGYVFEELLRKFSEMSNETAGEHYTPREVIDLMVELLLHGRTHAELTANPKPVRTVYDPAAGTGGMLMGALHGITEANPAATVHVFGQELNDETWAIAQSDLMMQGNVKQSIVDRGNSLTQDAFPGHHYDFILANPPYGVDWKSYAQPIKDEHDKQGFHGRFGAGTPRVSDGSLLFLQHMLSKMKPSGSRVGIVLSGSPLFSGAAGSGESEIRRWILEQDWLEGIVALPDQMFYNTGISTYVWILTNDKADEDRGLVRLVDARAMGTKMRKSLGDKRKELTTDAIAEIAQLYGGAKGEFADDSRVKVLRREEFAFQRITVERPLRRRWEVTPEAVVTEPFDHFASLVGRRFETEKALLTEVSDLAAKDKKALAKACAIADADAPIITKKGSPEPDPDLRDQENVPAPEGFFDIDEGSRPPVLEAVAEQHLADEIHPYVPDAWIDHTKTKIGVEIAFTRQFYVYKPPRPVEEIAAEIKALEGEIQGWMAGLGR